MNEVGKSTHMKETTPMEKIKTRTTSYNMCTLLKTAKFYCKYLI